MTGILWAGLGLLGGIFLTVLGDMASQEIRDRLDHLPHAILRIAARCLTREQHRTIYEDEWLPELTYILRGAEARPITRLATGTRYAFGIFLSARRITQRLHRAPDSRQLHARNTGDTFAGSISADLIAVVTAATKDIRLGIGDELRVGIEERQPDGTQLQAIAVQLCKDRRHWTVRRHKVDRQGLPIRQEP
jgi:hypothetical protein